MNEEWSEWFLHDGRGCPCVGMMVEYEAGEWKTGRVMLRGIIARVDGKHGWVKGRYRSRRSELEIIRYRIRKPKGLTILEGLLENLPEHETA